MLSWSINNTILIDGSEFIRIYNQYAPYFHIEKIKKNHDPRKIDDNYVTYFGYQYKVEGNY